MQRRAARAPLDHGDRDRERAARRGGRRAPRRRAQPTALTEIEPPPRRARARAPGRRRRARRSASRPRRSGALAEDEPERRRRRCRATLTRPTSEREPRREREEARPVHACGRGWRRSLAARLGRRPGAATMVLAVLAAPRRAGRCAPPASEQRLGARAEDAVAALELRAVDGEVGLVDQLVRVGAVLREPATPIETVARIGSLEVSTSNVALGDGAADPLGDLERLLGRRLGQEDRELLAAEAGRDVVVAQLRRGRSRRCPSGPRRRRGGRSCC